VKRLEAGEIAVVNHSDIDLVAADALVDAGVVAVVNAAESFTGRYPNLGPLQLVRHGVILLDEVGLGVMELISEGEVVTIDGDRLLIADDEVAVGHRQNEDDLVARVSEARSNVGQQLELFASNTLEYLRKERHLATDSPDLPPSTVQFKGRQTLVVVRGIDFREDLLALHRSGYIRELRPVLIGVDGGADALLSLGLKPHIIIGDMDSVGEAALRCGAELIVHAYAGGRAPGAKRLRELGLQYLLFESQPVARPLVRNCATGTVRGCRVLAAGCCRSAGWLLERYGVFLRQLREWCSLVLAKVQNLGWKVGGVALETACGGVLLGSLAGLTKGNIPGRMQDEYIGFAILAGLALGLLVGLANYLPARNCHPE
jgi:hypothetical protein